MVHLTRIYTRGGDRGLTSLGDGRRVAKHELRVEAYGTVDEANALLGVVRLHTRDQPVADALVARIQNDLFDLGADLCTPSQSVGASEGSGDPASGASARARLEIIAAQVSRLEREIDQLNAALPPLASFVLPGGTPAAAFLHQARTVIRRAERLVAALAEREPVNPQALIYLNRLSDLLFVLARALNAGADGDVLWIPGGNRT